MRRLVAPTLALVLLLQAPAWAAYSFSSSQLSGALPAISGAALTNLDAGAVATGTLPTLRGGTGVSAASLDAAGIVDKSSTQTGINGAKTWGNTQTYSGVCAFSSYLQLTANRTAFANLTAGSIYGSASGGAGYPFNANGHLVLEARANGASDTVFLTGSSGAVTMVLKGSNSNIGIGGTTSPTARLHLAAGTATASTAPLKFTAGTLLTAAEAWVMEPDATYLYMTIADAVRRRVVTTLNGSTTYDAPSIAAGGTTTTTITVTGAALGDFAQASFGVSTQGLVASASVTAADTLTIVLYNPTGSAIDLASTTIRGAVSPK